MLYSCYNKTIDHFYLNNFFKKNLWDNDFVSVVLVSFFTLDLGGFQKKLGWFFYYYISPCFPLLTGQQNPFHADISSLWNVYSGEISVFNIFSRIFTPPELKILANQSACESACGDIICWMDVPHFVRGAVIVEEVSKCLGKLFILTLPESSHFQH